MNANLKAHSNILARLRSWTRQRLESFNQDQSGAVAILCLAACMILFMVALVLYDTGKVARNKIDAQNAADSAAYSQAAVKARTMNMVMYANVAKRTIVSLHNTYFGMWTAWVAWTASRCSSCNIYNPKACYDCVINGLLAIAEAPDTIKYFGSVGSRYEKEIKALDKYQSYMAELTPWWAWSEGLVRGSRNGASITSSFPPPPGLILTKIPDWIETALQLFGKSLGNHTDMKDSMPLKKGSWLKMCVPTTAAALLETTANVAIHKSRSKEGAKKGSVVAAGAALAMTGGCLYSYSQFGSAMAPREPTAKGDSASALMSKSNVVFSYKSTPEMRGTLRNNYNILPGEFEPATALQYGSGQWNLSRGEFFFDGGSPDPWTPKWTAKVRPVALPGEFQELGADLNAMYHDVAPYMALSMLLSLGQSALTGGGGFMDGVSATAGDAVFLEKATRSLDNSVINGLNK